MMVALEQQRNRAPRHWLERLVELSRCAASFDYAVGESEC